MVVFKCKMCGGDLHPETGSTTCECEFCGTMQTVPTDDGEKKTNLFNRANRLRMNAEFDKAAAVYESIAAEFPEEAEAYWGLCLCAYGIEYVDDPSTGEKKPTCHRTLPMSIMEDSNFEQACDNADAIARRVYREEAKAIDRIQKDILSIVANETPYDVFICYKETADEGGRTEDSVLAQEIYDALTGKGLKVFFSRITLEDKLGQQYEPYIYAALSSAKIMLAIGTKYEYYDAVWVKNEWMRFLSMMKTEKSKTLIPCYKGIDAYDMPKEFKNLQGQDMGKLGWLQDLTRGIEKLLGTKNEQQNKSSESSMQADTYVKRAKLFVESGEWDKAIEYCEKVLDIDPENAQAYMAKELAERKCTCISDLSKFIYLHGGVESDSLKNARRFADSEIKAQLDELETKIQTAPDDLKKAFADKIRKEQSQPNWKGKKEKLEQVRVRAKILSHRLESGVSQLFVLNSEGKMICTETTDDQYGVYDSGKSASCSWQSRLRCFAMDGQRVYGFPIDGEAIRTQTKDNELDTYSKLDVNWNNISHWTKIKEIEGHEADSFGLVYGITEDGTVKVAGQLSDFYVDHDYYHGQDKVDHLTNISAFGLFSLSLGRVFFLCNDGTIQSTEYIGEDQYADVWSEMSKWTDIQELHEFGCRIVGTHSDGSFVMTRNYGKGKDESGFDGNIREIDTWSSIVQCDSSGFRIVGLSDTGKVFVTDYYGKEGEDERARKALESVREWYDIAYLYFPYGRIIGITVAGDVRCTEYFGNEEQVEDE